MLPTTADPEELASAMAVLADRAVAETRARHLDEFDFSTESLEWLEELIWEYDAGLNEWDSAADTELMGNLWGAYVGEVIRRHSSARWVRSHGIPALRLGGFTLFPIDKVRKRLAEGPEHNLVSFCGLFIDLTWREGGRDS